MHTHNSPDMHVRSRAGDLMDLSYIHIPLPGIPRSALSQACVDGDVAKAKALMAMGAPMVPPLPSTFGAVCLKGHVQVAEWLLGQAVVSANDLWECFTQACSNGQLAVAQWLWLHMPLEVSSDNIATVAHKACQGGHLHVLDWLNSVGALMNQELREALFHHACLQGCLDVAKWLHSLGGVDIHAKSNYAFYYAAFSQNAAHVAQWLFTLDPVRSAWPVWALRHLQAWPAPRDAWMRAVVRAS